jgi:biotin carboxyl carrier protein
LPRTETPAGGRKFQLREPAIASPASTDGPDGFSGEFLSIREKLVVARSWGRLQEADVSEGVRVEAGTILGQLWEQGAATFVVAPMAAVFLRWLVRDGERVAPGRPLALLLSMDGEE